MALVDNERSEGTEIDVFDIFFRQLFRMTLEAVLQFAEVSGPAINFRMDSF